MFGPSYWSFEGYGAQRVSRLYFDHRVPPEGDPWQEGAFCLRLLNPLLRRFRSPQTQYAQGFLFAIYNHLSRHFLQGTYRVASVWVETIMDPLTVEARKLKEPSPRNSKARHQYTVLTADGCDAHFAPKKPWETEIYGGIESFQGFLGGTGVAPSTASPF